ncbi:hypothetical protein VP01_592g12 [Puccinia sorghi]|uniref:Uncharacterized protein n=1 Tax=Puccinia sorghi TaxID=27349 RepID=A0A0L6UHQ5_9BASI|nr:hypothetical protein VP01_592g12 [Puccinia sorghi]
MIFLRTFIHPPVRNLHSNLDHNKSKSLRGLWDMVKMLSWISFQKSMTISMSMAQRIHVEKLGPCDIDHWMSMPTMGHLMAEVYNSSNNPPIFIGLTESQNFLVLKMKDENSFPTAQLEKNSEQIATPEEICQPLYY